MGFENMPAAQEAPKSELEQLQEDIEKTQNELLAINDPDAPETEWLKEKLQSLDKRLSQLEKPELRTQESYGIKKESALQKDIDAMAAKIRGEEEDRKAS